MKLVTMKEKDDYGRINDKWEGKIDRRVIMGWEMPHELRRDES